MTQTIEISRSVKWACPKCGSNQDGHDSAKNPDSCDRGRASCLGFICECDEVSETHGEAYATPCLEARCYHCEWVGKFPVPPKGLAPWEKKALAAGWTPPAGRLTGPSS